MWQDAGNQEQRDAPTQPDQLESREQQRHHRRERRKIARAQSQNLLEISNGESLDKTQSDVRTSAAVLPAVTETATKSTTSENSNSQKLNAGHDPNRSQSQSNLVRFKQISGDNSTVKHSCLRLRGAVEQRLRQHFLQQGARSRALTARRTDRHTPLR